MMYNNIFEGRVYCLEWSNFQCDNNALILVIQKHHMPYFLLTYDVENAQMMKFESRSIYSVWIDWNEGEWIICICTMCVASSYRARACWWFKRTMQEVWKPDFMIGFPLHTKFHVRLWRSLDVVRYTQLITYHLYDHLCVYAGIFAVNLYSPTCYLNTACQ